jgi:hypothetical protein
MNLRPIAVVAVLVGLAPATADAKQTLLATAIGTSYDAVANCLSRQIAPRLVAAPVVRPPPTYRAEVHLYTPGTQAAGTPVASFFVSQFNGGPTTIVFEERSDQRGQYTAAATAAAAQCAQ